MLKYNQMFSISDLTDYIFHHAEHETLGQSGERHLYLELKRYGVPRQQVFRNVYIPALSRSGKINGKTTEIDLLVLSRKGILIFEHKTYNGKVYGDGRHKQWVQYLSGKKSRFLSPVEQSRYHKICLQTFLKSSLPIYAFITHSQCGSWKVCHMPEDVYFLDRNGSFWRVYQKLPDADISSATMLELQQQIQPLERPTDGTREAHIVNFNHKL